MIIDTDSANEIDDLFAIIRSINEPKFKILGVTASNSTAPLMHRKIQH